MVNNTVNGKKIGRAAGKNDNTVLTVTEARKDNRQLISDRNAVSKKVMLQLQVGEFVSIKAYPGGNPNKVKSTRSNEGLTH